MNLAELAEEVAVALRERVLPALGSHAARAHAGDAAGGDVTFAMDADAEAFLEDLLPRRAPGVALYTEDRGLTGAEGAEHVLVVDPVDGTRPALAGFESACVSVAAAALRGGDPRMRDVEAGAIVEIKSGARFVAVRGEGVVRADAPVRLSANRDVERMFWVYGLRGRPARAMAEVLGDLLDASSVGGGTFELGSATYDMTRVLTGQLDAYVEPGPRMVEEVPGMLEEFRRVGGGAILNNAPYDVAAAVLCLSEAGAVVTDAAGRALDDRPLLGSGPEFQMSMLAVADPALHARLVDEIDRGIARLRGGRSRDG